MANNIEEHIIRLKDEMSSGLASINKSINSLRNNMHRLQKDNSAVMGKMSSSTKMFSGQAKSLTDKSKNATDSIKSLNKSFNVFAYAHYAQMIGNYLIRPVIDLGVASVEASIKMENLKNQFKAGFGPDNEKAFGFAIKTADELGISIEEALTGYQRLAFSTKGLGVSTAQLQKLFSATSKTIRALHLDSQQQSSLFLAMQQTLAKGKLAGEELNRQFANALPASFNVLMRAAQKAHPELNITKENFQDLVKQGKISSNVIFELANILEKDYGEAAKLAANSTEAQFTRMQNNVFKLKAAIGDELKPEILKTMGTLNSLLIESESRMSELMSPIIEITNLFIEFGKTLGFIKNNTQGFITILQAYIELVTFIPRMALKVLNVLAKTLKLLLAPVRFIIDKFIQLINLISNLFTDGSMETFKRDLANLFTIDFNKLIKQPFTDLLSFIRQEAGNVINIPFKILGFESPFKDTAKGISSKGKNKEDLIQQALNLRKQTVMNETTTGGDLKSGVSEIQATVPKNVTINIGSLVKENNQVFEGGLKGAPADQFKKQMTDLLISVINDSQTASER